VDGVFVGQLQICDANYGACGDTQAADTTTVAATTTNQAAFTDATVPAGVWIGLKTTSVADVPTSITVTMDYTVDAVN